MNVNSRNSYYNSQATVGRAAPAIEIKTVQDAERLVKLFQEFSQILGIIHAKWCGHCTRMMPKYQQLVNQGQSKTASFTVEESKLPMLNQALKDANMNEVTAEAFPTANIYGGPKASIIKSVSPDIVEVEKVLNSPTPVIMSMAPVSSGVVSPPAASIDQLPESNPVQPSPSIKGGNLVSVAGSAAYHLAPAAILLATAAATLKRCKKGSRKTRKGRNRNRNRRS